MSKEQRPFVPKTAVDFQKLKLERLMANPDKPVIIPELPKDRKGFSVPEFVRNVMGSSAGAGSGEFHVYRHLRRKEYTRQKVIEELAEREKLDAEFQKKLEENKRLIEERTAKKRAKRQKKKERMKNKRLKKSGRADLKNQEKKESCSDKGSSEEENSDSEPEESETGHCSSSEIDHKLDLEVHGESGNEETKCLRDTDEKSSERVNELSNPNTKASEDFC